MGQRHPDRAVGPAPAQPPHPRADFFPPASRPWAPTVLPWPAPVKRRPATGPAAPPEQYLTTSSDDGSVRVWEPEPVDCSPALRGHSGGAPTVRFSPNGTLLATGASDGQVRLWSPRREEPLKTLQDEGGAISVLRFSPRQQPLAWRWPRGQRGAVGGRDRSGGAAPGGLGAASGQGIFARDGHFVLLGWSDGEVRLQPQSAAPFVTAACQLLRQHPAPFLAVASKCAPYLAAADLLERPPLPQQLSPPTPVQAAAPEPTAADGGAPVAQSAPPQAAGGSAWRQDLARSTRAISAGCFAWSALHSAAVCRVGWRNSSGQKDIQERFSVRFPPAGRRHPDPARARRDRRSTRAAPALWNGPDRARARAAAAAVSDRPDRDPRAGAAAAGGAAGSDADAVSPRCARGLYAGPRAPSRQQQGASELYPVGALRQGQQAGKLALYHHPVPPGAAPQRIGQAVAVVQLMPGSRHLVLSLERRFEQAAPCRQQEDAAVVDLKTCTASTSFGEATP